ncbi:MAG: YceD family protein [bacterium]
MKLYLNEITEIVNSKKIDSFSKEEFWSGAKVSKVDLNLDFYRAGETVCLKFTGRYDFETVCDRCAADIEASLDVDESYYVFPESEGEDVDYFYSGESIETDEFVREILVMNMPNKILCSDQCKGLCSICGANLNDVSCGCLSGT